MISFRVALVAALVLAGCGSEIATPTPLPPSAPAASPAVPTGSSIEPSGAPTSSGPGSIEPSSPTASIEPSDAAHPGFAQLIGQKLVVRMNGITPSAGLLGRISRGEVGGVILFGSNITTKAALVALTGKLRSAAATGGQPPLLIAVDQEGGQIKRIPWAPPTLAPPQMGRDGRAPVARAQGASTGAALRALGINVDLAPVADVPGSHASFMYLDGRTFSSSATRTALLADAFASGLASEGVLPAMKHFPGIGLATRNTDTSVVTIRASSAALDPGLGPYRTAIAHDVRLIMLSNATYTAYDPLNAAGWSHAISVTLLRDELGFTGVTITDALDGTGIARGLSERQLAVRAAQAGTDMLLITGSEGESQAVYAGLLLGAQDGSIPTDTLQASYDRIIALKAGL